MFWVILIGIRSFAITVIKAKYISKLAASSMWFYSYNLLKTEDIHPPKTGISVHFSGSLV